MYANNRLPTWTIKDIITTIVLSVFIPKKNFLDHYGINVTFWVIKLGKDIFTWIYAISLFSENKILFALLFFPPFFKYLFISLGSLRRFKKNFRSNPLILLIILLLIVESFYELPIHIIFPLNKIYLHSNYYRNYDKRETTSINNLIEITEDFILLIYLVYFFSFGKFHYSAVVLIILDVFCLITFILFVIYFLSIEGRKKEVREGKVKFGEASIEVKRSDISYRNITESSSSKI